MFSNFDSIPLSRVDYLDKLSFNMVLMSPPCQPFTRIGLRKDVNDPRTKYGMSLDALSQNRLFKIHLPVQVIPAFSFGTSKAKDSATIPASGKCQRL